ncbi:MAG TPA: MerR family transcriptional regulator [Sorangium sp.]|nr:MerR family transcriptional regulator [Sorangium sp.]
MPVQLPDKLYFRIGEVATIVGVQAHVLRYWETEFRSVRPTKSRRGQRVYSRRDVETLLKVKELLYGHGYTIAGAKRRLRSGGIEPADDNDPMKREVQRLRDSLGALRGDILSAISNIQALGMLDAAAGVDTAHGSSHPPPLG